MSSRLPSLAFWIHGALIASATFYLISIPGATAQTSDAVCQSNFSWANNGRRQNPCVVAAYVQGACVGGQWSVPTLKSGQHYIGPSKEKASPCTCSTVAYNLVSACGLCQGQVAITWSLWSANCTAAQVSIGSYPQTIPAGTSIPAWAYLDPTTTDNLDLDLAETMADLPESTPVAGGATGNGGGGSQTGSPGPQGSNTPPPSSNSNSGPNIGAIVGGAVGGVVVLGLIVVGALFFFKRKNSKKTMYEPAPQMSSVFGGSGGGMPPTPGPGAHHPLLASSPAPHSTFSGGFSGAQSPPPQSVYGGSQSVYGQASYAGSVGAPTPRPYNPDDPTTFPPSLLSHPGREPTPVSSGGRYTGVAEI